MKSLIVGDKQTVERLVERLKQAGSHREYQRIQCVPIRATLGSSAGEIAQLLGWSTATVHVLRSRWAKVGDVIFDLRPRGGRRHQHLSVEQERERLAPFAERAHAGGMLTVTEIQQAYQRQVGQEVAPSTINRLLERHGWRKLTPRPRHPKADLTAQAAFKKMRCTRALRGTGVHRGCEKPAHGGRACDGVTGLGGAVGSRRLLRRQAVCAQSRKLALQGEIQSPGFH